MSDKKKTRQAKEGKDGPSDKPPASSTVTQTSDERRNATGEHRSPLENLYSANNTRNSVPAFTFSGRADSPGPSQPPGPSQGQFPMMMPWFMPPYGPMPMYQQPQWEGDQSSDEDTDDSADDLASMPELEPIKAPKNRGETSGSNENDPLASTRSRYVEAAGPALSDLYLKDLTNTMWQGKAQPQVMKELHELYPTPSNLDVHRVDVNEEVLRIMPKYAVVRDSRLRSIQNTLSRAPIPVVKASEILRASKAPGGKPVTGEGADELSKLCMDSVSMLAHANEQLNEFRRDIIKPTLKRKFQPICKLPKDADTSRMLLGENIGERIKQLKQSEQLCAKRPSRGFRGKRQHPYYQSMPMGMQAMTSTYGNFPGAQYGQYPGFGFPQPNTSYQGKDKPNFLGECFTPYDQSEESDITDIESDCESELHDSNSVFSAFRQGKRPRQAAVSEVMDSSPSGSEHPSVLVGELSIENVWPDFEAGRVSQCYQVWKTLTSDRHILGSIKHGYVIEFQDGPFQHKPAHEIRFNRQEFYFLKNELVSMLNKKIIVVSQQVEGEYVSNIFLREKKTPGKFRIILNLKKLNYHVEKHHFKMDTLVQTLALVRPNDWMISLDFEDAYYSLAIHRHSRKFLKFRFDGVLYEFTCLPNGLSSAPRYFTKVLKVMLAHMREHMGITITGYLDDQFILDNSYERVLAAGNSAAELFQKGGFKINLSKSVLSPTQQIEHLGFIIDSKQMVVRLTPEKRNKLRKLLLDCLDDRHMSIRQVATLAGKCLATKPANPWAMLYTKKIEKDKIEALADSGGNFDAIMSLSAESRKDLAWWLKNLDHLIGPIRTPPFDKVLKTDASSSGWGCFLEGGQIATGGRWSVAEQQAHINALELRAILLSLYSLGRNWSDCHVRLMTDNTTAVSSVNKQGSTHSDACNSITKEIWEFAFERNIWLSAVHLPGKDNVEADFASRKFQDETEWTLRQDVFDCLCRRLGQPDVDLFASRLNYQVKPYAAWKPDPEATMINSLMHPWGDFQCIYAFPPFSIVHLVIQKFIADGAEGILVVPDWKTKPWFTLFANIIVAKPLLIPVTNDLLFLPFHRSGQQEPRLSHPLAGKLRLIAARCTTDIGRLEVFRRQLSVPLNKEEENRPGHSIRPISTGGNFIVSRGTLIPFIHL